jgi:hypothetical protein
MRRELGQELCHGGCGLLAEEQIASRLNRKFFVPPACVAATLNSVVSSLDWLSTMTPGFRALCIAYIFVRVVVRVPEAESETGLTKVRRRACYGIRFAPVAADEYRFFKLVFVITQS